MTTARKAVPAAQPMLDRPRHPDVRQQQDLEVQPQNLEVQQAVERQRGRRRRFREELMAGLVLLVALLVTLLLLSLQWLHGASSALPLPHLTTTHGGLV